MKSGFISLSGRPNVGKSTLINKLVQEKVAITSDKAQTTRDNIRGIVNKGNNQFIFIDTPGIHKPKHKLGEYMTNSALHILKEVEVILMVLDGKQKIGPGDKFVFERIKEAKNVPRIALINKVDLMSNEEVKEKKRNIEKKLGFFHEMMEVSAKDGINVDLLLRTLEKYLEEGAMYYPEEMYTDMPMYKVITELIREKILWYTRDEIPHSVALEIINVEKRKKKHKNRYDINIYLERDSQKGIVIGKNGKMIKRIGMEARKEIEEVLGETIYLNLWVKVKKKWRKKKPFLKDVGYHIDV
ncbi:MAG: GTPase Era [Fusobacteriota bacterium]